MKLMTKARDLVAALIHRRSALQAGARIRGHYRVACRRADGSVRWVEEMSNLVVNQGLDHMLETELSAGSQVTSWYVGLYGSSPIPQSTWTAASHGSEFTSYDEATRQSFLDSGVSGQSLNNSSSKAAFTISANGQTIGGAFLISDSMKSGSSGYLFSAAAFSGGNKSADDDDVIEVTLTFTLADDGV